MCCQPRRVSAISISQRVGCELSDSKLCGYRIRGDSRIHGNKTKIEFVTTGIILRILQNGFESLNHISHLIIDEVHERSVEVDFLCCILRQWLRRYEKEGDISPPPKIILMSATIDSTKFSKYFDDAPVLKVSGRTFPVDISYLTEIVSMTKYVLERDSPYARRDVQDEYAPISATDGRDRTIKKESTSEEAKAIVARIDPSRVNDELIEKLLIYLKPSLKPGCTLYFYFSNLSFDIFSLPHSS